MSHTYNDSVVKEKRRNLRKNLTNAERKMWSMLRNKQICGLKFYCQYSVGHYILDFYCPNQRLAIEIDGGHHAEEEQQQHDNERNKYLKENDIKVIRFWNNEVLKNSEGVYEKILEMIKKDS